MASTPPPPPRVARPRRNSACRITSSPCADWRLRRRRRIHRADGGAHDIGGIGCFVGTVRANPDGPPLVRDPRALSGHDRACDCRHRRRRRTQRWPCSAAPWSPPSAASLPGENSVLVLAASAHRQAALDATAFLIDWLKTQAHSGSRRFSKRLHVWWRRRADDAAAARWGQASKTLPLPWGLGRKSGQVGGRVGAVKVCEATCTNPAPPTPLEEEGELPPHRWLLSAVHPGQNQNCRPTQPGD